MMEAGHSLHLIERDAADQLLGNSELEWIYNGDLAHDLTDAPVLGVLGEETYDKCGRYGDVLCGCYSLQGGPSAPVYAPIMARWGYAPYEARSFVQDLLERGSAVFSDHF